MPSTLRSRGVGRVRLTCCLLLVTLVASGCAALVAPPPQARDDRIGVSLITKDSTNPYFLAMQQGARRDAETYGVRLTVASGSAPDDAAGQVRAVDAAVVRGDRGIVITPVSAAVDGALTRARLAGLYVIALDTPPTSPDVVDVTFASDNREAGRLLGRWVADRLAGTDATVALLDAADGSVSVDRDRDQGFLAGLGVDLADPARVGDEAASGRYTAGKGGKYTIACQEQTGGTEEGGRAAMADCLRATPRLEVVYAVNEPAAFGALAALDAAGGRRPLVVTVDGSCTGVAAVRDGRLAALVQQDPLQMAGLGIGSVARIARGGVKPSPSERLGYVDTGVDLVTDLPVPGLASIDIDTAAGRCWG